ARDGKWYRHISHDACSDQTIWPSAGTANLEDYEVPESVIERLNRVKRRGFTLPNWIIGSVDFLGSIAGLNEELGLALLAYAIGEEGSDEEREQLLTNIKLTIGAIAAVAVAGLAVSAFLPGVGGAIVGGAIALGKVLLRALLKGAQKLVKAGTWLFSKIARKLSKSVAPDDAIAALAHIRKCGTKVPGTKKGGVKWKNKDRSLPTHDASGKEITYMEWD